MWVFWAISLALLLAGFCMGLIWTHHFLHFLKPSIERIQQVATHILRHGSVWVAIWTVFWNNARVALLMMGLGVFAGVFPIFTLWSNGLMMGVVTQVVAHHEHTPAWRVLVFGELPHGVFELAALVWASAIGIKLGLAAVESLWALLSPSSANDLPSGGDVLATGRLAAPRRTRFWIEVVRAVERLPFIMAILLVAACIEITITPHLIHLYQVARH